jgi:soluble lytic murein transglycosylase
MKMRASSLMFLTALLGSAPVFAGDPALTELGQGITAWNARDYQTAISHLHGEKIPKLSDYQTYYLASAQQQAGDYDNAISLLAAYRESPIPSSPLAGKISLLYARVVLDKRDPSAAARALAILESDHKLLPQPDGDFALALAYEATGEKPQAATAFEQVYYTWPNTDLAAQSWTAMERLRGIMGSEFPQPTERQKLDRCQKWVEARQYRHARAEYAALADNLTGAEKDEARVGAAVADFLGGDARTAFRSLKALSLPKSETDAWRLYFITESARKLTDDASMMEAVRDLGEHYPKSPWRLKSLVAAGSRYVVTNDRDKYTPLFKAAFETFPSDTATAYCHWKVTWDTYLDGKPERQSLLREQIERYPTDSHTSAALYYLGRTSEVAGNLPQARAYYERLSAQYPHYFYGVLARERVKDANVAAVQPDEAAKNWLAGIGWPAHRDLSASEPNEATRRRLDRAHLLTLAGLPDVAEGELRFGAAATSEQPQLLAMDLAGGEPSPFRALRIMKSFSADYLALPTENASPKFWQMLFPLPYKDEVFRNSSQRGLDPFHVAALIRQESEFNPGARSHANAYGLMQLMPATGRMLARVQGLGPIGPGKLLVPAINIQLGTQYLRDQLNTWSDDWYKTLAAYNAGPNRVREWTSWARVNEPAEFVESIPFNETREYVQAVLRNADMYRELYAGKVIPQITEPKTTLVARKKVTAPPKPAASGAKTSISVEASKKHAPA